MCWLAAGRGQAAQAEQKEQQQNKGLKTCNGSDDDENLLCKGRKELVFSVQDEGLKAA